MATNRIEKACRRGRAGAWPFIVVAGFTACIGCGSEDGAADPAVPALQLMSAIVPAAPWSRTYGQSGQETGTCIDRTSDGGLLCAGATDSYFGGALSAWIARMDSSGNIVWENAYGGGLGSWIQCIRRTTDEGLIAAGHRVASNGRQDLWVMKLAADGSINWEMTLGSSGDDAALTVRPTADGGYLVGGYTFSYGSGASDAWMLKLSAAGDVAWQRTCGGAGSEWVYDIEPTADGGAIVAGSTSSCGAGDYDFWVLKLDAAGDVSWQRAYGGGSDDWASSIRVSATGGYLVCGNTRSFGSGSYDTWLVKISDTGVAAWTKRYGGTGSDTAASLQVTPDGGALLAGATDSPGAGGRDAWLLKMDASGRIEWQKSYGGPVNDCNTWIDVRMNPDGSCVVACDTPSESGQGRDLWLFTPAPGGSIVFSPQSGLVAGTPAVTSSSTPSTVTFTSFVPASSAAAPVVPGTTVVSTAMIVRIQAP